MSQAKKSRARVKQTSEKTYSKLESHQCLKLGNEAQRLRNLDRAIKRLEDQELFALGYDIAVHKLRDCPNPSDFLWKYGFRWLQSCWILTEESLESDEVQELLDLWDMHNIKYNVIPWAGYACQQIRSIARDQLAGEMARVHTSLIKRMADADERLGEAMNLIESQDSNKTPEQVEATHYHARYVALRQSQAALENCIACAERFDVQGDVESLVEGLRKACESELRALDALKMARQQEQEA
jgi:hypothetical protein